jgi:hypothetical protein
MLATNSLAESKGLSAGSGTLGKYRPSDAFRGRFRALLTLPVLLPGAGLPDSRSQISKFAARARVSAVRDRRRWCSADGEQSRARTLG